LFRILFIYLLAMLISSRYHYAAMTLRIFKSSMFKTLSSHLWETKASDPLTCWSYIVSFSGIHIVMHALIFVPMPHTLGMWVHTWLVMLSHAVMSVVQVFHHLWCWVWLVSLWEMVFHPSRCDLTVVRIDAMVWARLEWWRRLDFVRWCGLSCSNLLRTES
jgi:hypothetical protein